MMLPALRAALRMARRDALRAPGRSILVVSMIALPIIGLSAADVLFRTGQLSASEQIDRELGGADALVRWGGGGAVEQDPAGMASSPSAQDAPPENRPAPPVQDLLRALPGGSTVVSRASVRGAVRTKDGLKVTELIAFDYTAAPVRTLVRQVTGRSPRASTEVVLTRPLAHAIGLRVGDTLEVSRPGRKSYRVVGIAEDPYALRAEYAYTVPGGLPSSESSADQVPDTSPQEWYVDTPGPLSWPAVLALNEEGYTAISRAVVLQPPPRSQVPFYRHGAGASTGPGGQLIAAGALAVGMALLEVVLLAGPAFAVGARRRRRELALVAATGGDQRDVRNIVLGGGAVLGLAAATMGVAMGIGLAAAALPLLERLAGSVSGPFDIRPLELAGIASVGILTGLLAAVLPARAAARQDVVAALAGRRGVVRTRARVPLIGLTLALLGTALALGGAALMKSFVAVLGGAVITEIGLIVCTPGLLGLVGRLGRRLPLSPRLALRDASRNRSSTTPAVAAVMAAVAGTVGIGIVIASQAAHDRATYRPSLGRGDAIVQFGPETAALAPQVADVLRSTLPARQVVEVKSDPCPGVNSSDCVDVSVDVPKDRLCPLYNLTQRTTKAAERQYAHDPRCTHMFQESASYLPNGAVVDDGSALPALAGAPVREAVAALRAGKVVVFDPWYIENGRVTLVTRKMSSNPDTKPLATLTVAAVVLAPQVQFGQVILPPDLARRLGVHEEVTAVYADNRTMPSDRQEQAAQGALAKLGSDVQLNIERGYIDRYNIGLLALVIGAGVITLGAAAIATALSNVDGRHDLTTLAAVGASPRVRRMLSMSRAGVIALLGAALGTLAGFVPAAGVVYAQRALEGSRPGRRLEIPWSSLAVTALVVPAIAILVAGLFSRSRLPIERRAAT